MTHRHPCARRLVLVLAWLLAGPAHADQHVPDAGKLAFDKIVEARGQARVRRYPEALKQLDEAVSLARTMEARLPLALAFHNIAEVRVLRGEPLEALKAYNRALGVYTGLGHEAGAGMVQRRIAALSRLLGKAVEPAAPAPEAGAPAGAEEPRSAIQQALERVRRRKQIRERAAREAAESGPVRVTRSAPDAAEDSGAWDYVEALRQKIRGNSRYPDYARRTRQEGVVDLVFAVRRNGEVENVELLKSSGFIVLDVEALRNVRESAPFAAVPDGAGPAPLTVRFTFSYKLPAPPGSIPVPVETR